MPTDLARSVNDTAAELIDRHSGRFGAFAALPLPDIDAGIAEHRTQRSMTFISTALGCSRTTVTCTSVIRGSTSSSTS